MILKDQCVIVTGGAQGIGGYLVQELSNLTIKVIVIDINETVLEIYKENNNVFPYICDVTNYEAVSEVINTIYNEHSPTVLINNAGYIFNAPLINLMDRKDKRHNFDDWDKTIKINLDSVFNVGVNVADKLISNRKKGVIINISSISAQGNIGQSAYSAAKAGIEALTKTWSKELSMFGIRTACIAPGFFDTPSTQKALSESTIEKYKKNIPLKRFGKLEEILITVNFIIENDYFNGKILEIDGGLTI